MLPTVYDYVLVTSDLPKPITEKAIANLFGSMGPIPDASPFYAHEDGPDGIPKAFIYRGTLAFVGEEGNATTDRIADLIEACFVKGAQLDVRFMLTLTSLRTGRMYSTLEREVRA